MTKKTKSILFAVLAILLMVATVPAAIWVTHTQTAELGNSRARCGRKASVRHQITIQNGVVSPANINAKKCDALIITNLDSQQRLIAFGRHDNHISYDGVSEKLLDRGASLQVTMIRSGDYLFHDHNDALVRGTFNVTD
jgi:hypothetical protein